MSSNRALLLEARAKLAATSETPQLDAEVLLAHVLGVERVQIIADAARTASMDEVAQYLRLIDRRSNSEPVAYLTGEREFYGRKFSVSPSVLIPRPDTELLVDLAVQYLETIAAPRILELATGSGCIAISVALELHDREVQSDILASDISPDALRVAERNAAKLGASSLVRFLESDWFKTISKSRFDCILINPPYVERDATLATDLSFEPAGALFADDNGLSELRLLIQESPDWLLPGGKLFLECGAGQWDVLKADSELFLPYRSRAHKDLQGYDRVIECELLHPNHRS
ncbi:MAG: peptide chain release factor N(5)-glutamine methyltransferase [Bdellovibrionales bacterium]|nr:peptide chain release factor N(5)-glutamine methyltransferase [Bdellovibrionales bacterium]